MRHDKERRRGAATAFLGVAGVILAWAVLCGGSGGNPQTAYGDVLDIKNVPAAPEDRAAFFFSDLGSWEGFALPPDAAKDLAGSFPGPFLITSGRWLSRSLVQFVVFDAAGGRSVKPAAASSLRSAYYPGLLTQEYAVDGFRVLLRLIFISSRSVLVSAEMTNVSREARRVRTGWRGALLAPSASFAAAGDAVRIIMKDCPEYGKIEFFGGPETRIEIGDGRSYQAVSDGIVGLNPEETLRTAAVQSFFLAAADEQREEALRGRAGRRPSVFLARNADRWNGYLNRILNAKSPWLQEAAYRKIAVKALMTLMTNWRCARGDLLHDGLFPSSAVRYFNGFWAWDSWKHAAALARFAPDVAKDQILAMFDYQDSSGMIDDCIFADRSDNNRRNTKPPLAAWAVREVYRQTRDRELVRGIFPKLLKYHAWWYARRDHDGNGLCEYGSTDGTREAAAWESGMDNAVRFDEAAMVSNGDGAWSLNQESVDLNSYLYAEKIHLAELAGILGEDKKAHEFLAEAEKIKALIRGLMYDEAAGYFFDIRLGSKEKIRVEGPEGWIPLWAGAAGPAQAAKVKAVIVNESKFNTYVPFPTVARDHPKYEIDGYWRGPVWLDQAYFGARGLTEYGFGDDARRMVRKLLDHPAGLKDSSAPIRENYDPDTGRGLQAGHFSWSSAHFLLLILGE